jgi:ATP-binding cassette subfamily G (WHITE) protein 2 (PDR)
MFLYIESFLIFTSTFATMVIAAMDTAETAGNIANLMFSLSLVFCGVLVAGNALPRFWIFMYRVSPFTYLVEGMLGVGVANTQVECSDTELLEITTPGTQTCGEYLQQWVSQAGGQIINPDATGTCQFCALDSTNNFLAQFEISYANRWRNYGLLFAYIVFNIAAAIFLYWLVRVPKKSGKEQATPDEGQEKAQQEKK